MLKIHPNLYSGPRWMCRSSTQIDNTHSKNLLWPLFCFTYTQINSCFKYLVRSFIIAIDSKVKITTFGIVSKFPLWLNVILEKTYRLNFPFLNSKFILLEAAIIGVNEKVLCVSYPFPQKHKIIPWVHFLNLHKVTAVIDTVLRVTAVWKPQRPLGWKEFSCYNFSLVCLLNLRHFVCNLFKKS